MSDSLFEELLAENDKEIEDRTREKYEWQKLVEKASKFIGCEDKSMWSLAVVDAALHHANFISREWESCLKIIREKDAEIDFRAKTNKSNVESYYDSETRGRLKDAEIKRLRDAIRKIEDNPDEAYEIAEPILRETT